MKESSHLGGDTSIHIIYQCIEDARLSALRDNIIISNCCWYQCAIALFKQNFFARASHSDFAVTLYTHSDDEAIIFPQIPMKGL